MNSPGPADKVTTPAPQARLMTPQFIVLLATTSCYGFAWSFYLILPKFLATELKLEAGAIGAIVAISGLSAVLATPVIGKLVDRYGRRNWIAVGNALIAITGIGFLFIDRPGALLYTMQVTQGIGFATAFTASGTLTADLAPRGRMAQAIGIFGAANLSMSAISPTVGEILADSVGWDTVFTVSAVAAVLAGVFSRLVREPPPTPPTESRTKPTVLHWGLSSVYLGVFAFTASFAALFTLHQPYAISRGVTELRSFFIGFTILALVMRLGFGSQIDRFGAFRASVTSMTLYAAVPPMLALLGPGHLWIVGASLGCTHGVLYPASSALALERADESAKGMVFSIMSGAFNAGFALFSLLLGLLAERSSYEAAFWVASAITLGGVGALWLSRHKASRAYE